MSKSNIPTPDQLQMLPPWAIVSFAARCAQRVTPKANPMLKNYQAYQSYGSPPPEDYINAVNHLVGLTANAAAAGDLIRSIIEEAKRKVEDAANAYYKSMTDKGHEEYPGSPHDFDAWYDSHHDMGFEFKKSADAAIAAANAALMAKSSISSAIAAAEAAEAAKCVYITPWYTYPKADNFLMAIQRDFELLRETAKLQGWKEQTTVDQDFFALRSEFELDAETKRGTIIQISSEINAKLLDYFVKYPERLYSLKPRQFEELIGELFDGFGYQVEITSRTRDGGRDIIAIKHEIVEVKYLIECKRYAKNRTVGIAPVQRLHGVTQAEQATKGILVTTAPAFTKPAMEFLERHRWVLQGRDFNGLLEWLREYQEFQMRKLKI